MFGLKKHSNNIICIGSGNEKSAIKAENIAKKYNKDFIPELEECRKYVR